MTIRARVFDTEELAEAFADTVSTAMGCPIPGRPVGGGIHAPPERAVTTRYAAPFALRSGKYAVQVAPEVEAINGTRGVVTTGTRAVEAAEVADVKGGM